MLAAIRSDGYEELYAYGPEGLHAQRTITGTTDTLSYALLDAQGSLTQGSGSWDWGSGHMVTHCTALHPRPLASKPHPLTQWQDGNLVYLRARWYHTGLGTFTTRDTFQGMPDRPQSLHRYAYAENRPSMLVDPSGRSVDENGHWTPCTMLPGRADTCTAQDYRDWWDSKQWETFWDKLNTPSVVCHRPHDPSTQIQPIDTGLIISYSLSGGAIAINSSFAIDIVIDLYGFGIGVYRSPSNGMTTLAPPNVAAKKAVGIITGWSKFNFKTVDNYAGGSWTSGVSVPIPIEGIPFAIGLNYGTNAHTGVDIPAFELQWLQISGGVELGLEGVHEVLDFLSGSAGFNYGVSTPWVSMDMRSAGPEPTASDGTTFKNLVHMLLPQDDWRWVATFPMLDQIIDHNSAYWEEKHG